MKKRIPVAELRINKKLYEMSKPNVKDLVKWLRYTVTDISKNYRKFTKVKFRKYE